MPKISQLPAGSTITGAEEIPMVQLGVTKRTSPAALGAYLGTGSSSGTNLGWFNVKDYGAVGDGVVNDTTAIRTAYSAAKAAGGGTIYFPCGTYLLIPTSKEVAVDGGAVNIYQANNITIRGDGWPGRSKIKFMCFGGVDPDVAPPPLNGAGEVFRGSAFFVYAQTGFRCEDIEIDGNASRGSAAPIPADPVTGDGWDITHHAIQLAPNEVHDDVIIRNCWFHGFRGEIIAYGGTGLGRIKILDCRLNIGTDAISMTMTDIEVRDCEIYDVFQGIENAYINGRGVYANNYFHDINNVGFNVIPCFGGDVSYAMVDCRDNHFRNCVNAILSQGANNMRIYNNYMIDCGNGISITSPGAGGGGTETIYASNVQIYGNTFVTDTISSTGQAIYLDAAAANQMTRISVRDNVMNTTVHGETNGKTMRGLSLGQPMLHGTGQNDVSVVDNSTYSGAIGSATSDTWIDETFDYLLATTGETSVLFVQDDRDYLRTFDVFYEVKTAPTNLTLKIKYYDSSGTLQTITWLSGVQAVGVYSASYNVSPHYGNNGTSNNTLQLTAQAGTASQIKISARVRD